MNIQSIFQVSTWTHLVGEGRAQSDAYPAAYRNSQTPFNRGDIVGLTVGFIDSNFSKASLIADRASLVTSPESPLNLSNTEVMRASLSVGTYGSLSIVRTPSMSEEVSDGSLMDTGMVLTKDLDVAQMMNPLTCMNKVSNEKILINIIDC